MDKEIKDYIIIKDLKVPFKIKSFKNSKTIKFFFRNDVLIITKPKYFAKYKLDSLIEKNKDYIYDKYSKIINEKKLKKDWFEKDIFYIKGNNYKIKFIYFNNKNVKVNINDESNEVELFIYKDFLLNNNKEKIKNILDKKIKNALKEKTKCHLDNRLIYWSKIMNLSFKEFLVRDAISKYGSCKPKEKKLYFSSRLIMLPEIVIDAIIVHELSHLVYANHSRSFYNLIENYIPDYSKINKWLKKNPSYIMF